MDEFNKLLILPRLVCKKQRRLNHTGTSIDPFWHHDNLNKVALYLKQRFNSINPKDTHSIFAEVPSGLLEMLEMLEDD